MRRLLLVTTDNPMVPSSGSARLTKLLQRLKRFGFAPTILTLAADTDAPSAALEEFHFVAIPEKASRSVTLMRKGLAFTSLDRDGGGGSVPRWRRVSRRFLHSLNLLEFPDGNRPVIRAGIAAGVRVAREQAVDVILSSASAGSVSGHFIARAVSRKLALPWVQEYRDIWVRNPWRGQQPYWFRDWLELRWERRLLRDADRTIVVNEANAKVLAGRHDSRLGARIRLVTHGYDPEDYSPTDASSCALPLRIVYTGSLYAGKRDVSPFFAAIRRLVDSEEVSISELEFVYAGGDGGAVMRKASQAGVAAIVRNAGRVSMEAARQLQTDADLLLLLEDADDNPWVRGNLGGKAFEYLGAGRPILALAHPRGAIASLYRETHAGRTFHPHETEKIAATIAAAVSTLKAGRPLPHDPDERAMRRHSWDEVGRRLVSVLEEAIAHRH